MTRGEHERLFSSFSLSFPLRQIYTFCSGSLLSDESSAARQELKPQNWSFRRNVREKSRTCFRPRSYPNQAECTNCISSRAISDGVGRFCFGSVKNYQVFHNFAREAANFSNPSLNGLKLDAMFRQGHNRGYTSVVELDYEVRNAHGTASGITSSSSSSMYLNKKSLGDAFHYSDERREWVV